MRDSSISDDVTSNYVIRTISSRSIDDSGKTLLKNLPGNSSQVDGVPYILVVDPVTNKVQGVIKGKVLATAERNTVKLKDKMDYLSNPWVGYDSSKVKALIDAL